ncbi:MAG: flagellar filament capping protein FliD [Lachnospiraceae bacterium]|jgi:Flagellar capping protein|nr:flagellar filament capping protein FliD [Lachnospiraceae bacterium]
MPIRMTGLNSGLNTESIVAALMSAQRTKMTKVENKKTKLEWKKDIWSSLNTKIYDFYTKSLSKMRLKSNYMTKAASSSNTTKVVAKASTKAATGTYTVKVNKLASTQSVTSGKLNTVTVKNDTGADTEVAATSKTKLKDLKDASGNKTFTNGTQIKIENDANDKKVYLDVDDNTTIQDFLDKCTSAGLTATFDEKQQRFFISSEKSGAGNAFKITSSTITDNTQQTAVDDLKKEIGYSNLSASDRAAVDTILAGMRDNPGAALSADDQAKLEELAAANAESVASQKANAYVYDTVAKPKAQTDYTNELTGWTQIDTTVSKEIDFLNHRGQNLSAGASADEIAKAKEAVIENMAKADFAEDPSSSYKTAIDSYIQNGITGQGPDYDFSSATNRPNESKTAVGNAINAYKSAFTSTAAPAEDGSALAALGLSNVDGTAVSEQKDAAGNILGTGMVVIDAKDTEVEYNGATLTSNTTNISVSGLELEILGTTEGETVNITVTNDVSGIYDTIKDFLSEYNALLKEMNSYYNADSAKGYDVLSDDEKEAMKDSEVEKWEDKIKDSLLRRDSTLNSIISSFRNKMMGTFTASNGKTYSLSSIGISTSGDYAEGGLLHIRGDEDDAEYADEKNVLKQLLEEDPDAVTDVFTHLTESLYTDLQKKMSRTPLSSALTFYNDKEMNSQLSDYKTRISKLEAKFNEMEDRYYKQFTAMEKAMANMQSQQNSLASYLGG